MAIVRDQSEKSKHEKFCLVFIYNLLVRQTNLGTKNTFSQKVDFTLQDDLKTTLEFFLLFFMIVLKNLKKQKVSPRAYLTITCQSRQPHFQIPSLSFNSLLVLTNNCWIVSWYFYIYLNMYPSPMKFANSKNCIFFNMCK